MDPEVAMQATAVLGRDWRHAAAIAASPRAPAAGRLPAQEPAGFRPRFHGAGMAAWAEAEARADRAERRLRSRLVALTWPAALGGIAGGFVGIFALRIAGL
jgi:hypothetical protein